MAWGGGPLGSEAAATVHSRLHGSFHDMLNTYGQHGADNLSLWLTNAKEAAAKITEATRARQREKEEKYSKFLRDLHSRVASSSKERSISKIPPARPSRLHHDQVESDSTLPRSKPDGTTAHEGEQDLCAKDLFKQVPRMDKVQDVVNSEPCTPTGWNLIPTPFSAPEMRSLECVASPTASGTGETGNMNKDTPQVVSPKVDSRHIEEQIHPLTLPTRTRSSASTFCRIGPRQMRGKENVRSNTSTGDSPVKENNLAHTKEPVARISSSHSRPRQSPAAHTASTLNNSNEGVTTCSLGVVVLKGREEYEVRGQGKQFFSDVWKCAMEVERRCAHDRACSLHILKKKRLEQQRVEKRHKVEMLRERSLAKQREAVQKQLKTVETLKARRDGIVQRHRAVEKKRYLSKDWDKEKVDHLEGCETEGCESDLINTQRLLCSDTTKTWLKLQALHKQLYLNLLAEKKWMRH